VMVAISVVLIRVPDHDWRGKQVHLAMRAIGDGLLRASGDHSTPVLPVQDTGAGTYRLEFDAPMPVNPDRLVELSMKYLHADVVTNAIVNVHSLDAGENCLRL